MSTDERLPIQTIRELDYDLVILWLQEPDDPADWNVDIEICTEDGRYSATVFTLRNVATLLEKFRATGEKPSYLRMPDALIVDEPITEALLRRVASEAVATGELHGLPRLDDGA